MLTTSFCQLPYRTKLLYSTKAEKLSILPPSVTFVKPALSIIVLAIIERLPDSQYSVISSPLSVFGKIPCIISMMS